MSAGVVGLHEDIDLLHQFSYTAESSAPDSLLRDPVKPKLYLIQPGGVGGREVHLESRPLGQPPLDPCMLMGGIVVHNDVHVQRREYVLVNLPQKVQIFLMPVALSALREYCSLGRIQCRQQGGRSVA